MPLNNQLKYTGNYLEMDLIKEFGILINTNKMTFLDKNRYDYLLDTMMELAENKNYSDAQYYLARHFLLANDINNYKFWLMRAAKNNNAHPLANLKVIKFCLEKYHELWSSRAEEAEKYLTTARKHLNFIKAFKTTDLQQRIDWLYVKEQADIIWQKEFEETTAATQIWQMPANCSVLAQHGINYFTKLSQQAEKISIRFKGALQKWKVKQV